jgi:hypothetical protein
MRVRFNREMAFSQDGLRVTKAGEGQVMDLSDDLAKAFVRDGTVAEAQDAELESDVGHLPGFGSFPTDVLHKDLGGASTREGWGPRDPDAGSTEADRALVGNLVNAASTLITERPPADASERFQAALRQLVIAVGRLRKAVPVIPTLKEYVAGDEGAVTRGREAEYRQPARYDYQTFHNPSIPERDLGPAAEPGGLQRAAHMATDPNATIQTARQLKMEEPVTTVRASELPEGPVAPGHPPPPTGQPTPPQEPPPSQDEVDDDGDDKGDDPQRTQRKARQSAPANKSRG